VLFEQDCDLLIATVRSGWGIFTVSRSCKLTR